MNDERKDEEEIYFENNLTVLEIFQFNFLPPPKNKWKIIDRNTPSIGHRKNKQDRINGMCT